jgi:RNA polymerase sigma-70 factor (ECF subfamily)
MVASNSPSDEVPSTFLRDVVERFQRGDEAASEELLARIGTRLEMLAGRMLRRFPQVRRFEQTGDVVQGATLRLLRALREVRPATCREFFALAAEQVRRELIDLSRHYSGPHGWGTHHDSNVDLVESSGRQALALEPAAPHETPEDLERWTAFHEAVASLPAEEREVFGLTFYHGWEQKEIGELLAMDERTVRRKWRHACQHLNRLLEGGMPQGV